MTSVVSENRKKVLTMDVREKLAELLQDENNPVWRWFPNNMAMTQLADYLIANGVTVQEWISVEDRLPEEKVNCIVHYKHAYCDTDGYWAIGFCCYDGEKFKFDPAYKVTHWMPLPEPPKEE